MSFLPRRSRRTVLCSSAIACVAALSPAAALAETLDNMAAQGSPTDLEQVVVTAAGFEQKVAQAPASITVLPREELQEIRANSIAEALTTVEGVDVGDSVGKTGGLNINIRGMGSDYTLVLIDGRRQNTGGSVTPNGFGETSTSFLPPVSAIDRMEVVRGPVSTLYGSDAMGGVVNIITRKVGDRWSGSVGLDATLQTDREFGGANGGNFYAHGPLLPDLLGLAVRGSFFNREASNLTYRDATGAARPVTGFGPSPTRSEIRTLGGRLSLTPHPDHDLWLDVDTARQWYDNSESQMGTATTAGGYGPALEFNRDQYVLAHNWRLPFGALESTLSRGVTETVGRIIPPGVPGAGDPRTLETTSDTFDTKLHSAWRNHTFTVGGQYWNAELIDGVAPAPFEFQQWAIFAEDEWRFTDALALTLGARHDDHSTFGSHFSPRAYLVWNASEQWTVKGGVSQGFKTPRVEQLTPGINGFGRQGTLPLIGTPTLTPETSTSTEVGVYYDSLAGFRANVTAFHNDFQDKIASGTPVANCTYNLTEAQYLAGNYSTDNCVDVGHFPDANPSEFGQSINVDEAVTQGVEAAARWRLTDAWTLSANYTYTDSEQKSGAEAGRPLTNTPEHMANAQLRWAATDRLTGWLRGEYRSERYRSEDSGSGNAKALHGDYKAYNVFHLGGSYEVSDQVRLNATIYNLFDRDFVQYEPAIATNGGPVAVNRYINNQEPRRLWVSVNVEF